LRNQPLTNAAVALESLEQRRLFALPVELDVSFGDAGGAEGSRSAYSDGAVTIPLSRRASMLVQPFYDYDVRSSRLVITRFRADGSRDATYGIEGQVTTGPLDARDIARVVLGRDGTLVALFTDDEAKTALLKKIRLDGALVKGFGSTFSLDAGDSSSDSFHRLGMIELRDGRWALGAASPSGDPVVVILDASGRPDTGGVIRVFDATLGADVVDIAQTSDGSIVGIVRGSYVDGNHHFHLPMRGESFGKRTVTGTEGSEPRAIVALPAGGYAYSAGQEIRYHAASGALARTVRLSEVGPINAMAVDATGRIVVSCESDSVRGLKNALVAVQANGKIDPSFGESGYLDAYGDRLAINSAGDVLANNERYVFRYAVRPALALSPEGKLVIGTDTGDDRVGLRVRDGSIRLVLNGRVKRIPLNLVTGIDIRTGPGNDVVTAAVDVPITLRGDAGDDQLIVDTTHKSNLIGDAGNDVLQGGSGDDSLFGGDGADTLRGMAGYDRFWTTNDAVLRDRAADIVDGGRDLGIVHRGYDRVDIFTNVEGTFG
jgi:hypothetical protein